MTGFRLVSGRECPGRFGHLVPYKRLENSHCPHLEKTLYKNEYAYFREGQNKK